MGNNRHGFFNENSIANYLNGKKFKDLNQNMKNFINWLFKNVNDETLIHSEIIKRPIGERKNPKPDIWIKVNNDIQNISVKEGSGNSVHQEPFFEFCKFLQRINVETEIINNLKLYHFGDDTLDGTGELRYSTAKIKEKYKLKINNANNILNNNFVLEKILDRILFDGALEFPIRADVCYHGDLNNGLWASRNEIQEFLKNSKPEIMSGIMFSKLTYQPWTRDEHRTAKHPERRLTMQVKWGSMLGDLSKIIAWRNGNV